jgi:6-methylsalicylate decarboxylase
MTPSGTIDTHHHVLPPVWTDWLHSHGLDTIGRSGIALPAWSPGAAIAYLDEAGIAAAVVSISTPGVHLGDDVEARRMARVVNEQVAELVKDHPDRFGFFATLTLPDVDGAIAEAAEAFDRLGADGVILLASVEGRYLGDPAFDPLMAALDERSAVVFVHPGPLAGPSVPGLPEFIADFLLDTTRAALLMARNGVLDRYPRLKILLSHGGGFLPYAAERFTTLPGGLDPVNGPAQLRRFYFDTALTASPVALPSLLAFADPQRITYGSDFPYAQPTVAGHFAANLQSYPLDDATRRAIDHDNAAALFPRLATR